MPPPTTFALGPIGRVRSLLTRRAEAPKQGFEGAPDSLIEIARRSGPRSTAFTRATKSWC
jgi:hypothetical protein